MKKIMGLLIFLGMAQIALADECWDGVWSMQKTMQDSKKEIAQNSRDNMDIIKQVRDTWRGGGCKGTSYLDSAYDKFQAAWIGANGISASWTTFASCDSAYNQLSSEVKELERASDDFDSGVSLYETFQRMND